MHAVAHLAPSAIVLASALGAAIMCLLVLRYGFAPPAGEAGGGAATRLLVTRLGHAAAGVCFAVAGILAVVLLVQQSRPAAGVTPPPRDPEIGRLRRDVDALAGRVASDEARAGAVEARVAASARALSRRRRSSTAWRRAWQPRRPRCARRGPTSTASRPG